MKNHPQVKIPAPHTFPLGVFRAEQTSTEGGGSSSAGGISVESVTFGGENQTVYKDPTSSSSDDAYASPEWTSPDSDDGGHQYPVCYVRNAKVSVSATFKSDDSSYSGEVKIKGKATCTFAGEQYNFNFAPVSVDFSSGEGNYAMKEAPSELPDTIEYVDSFDIDWSVSTDGGETYIDAGSSSNPLYIVLHTPICDTLWETLLFVSCGNAQGKNSDGDAFSSIWSFIKNLNVTKVDGTPSGGITYWGSTSSSGYTNTQQLLINNDGECGAWQGFMLDILNSQGISGMDSISIVPDPSAVRGVGQPVVAAAILMATWDLSSYTNNAFSDHLPLESEFDSCAMPAQGGTPGIQQAAIFNAHAVVKYNDQYYDPSYGLGPYPDLNSWQQDALQAVLFGSEDHTEVLYEIKADTDTWPQYVTEGT